MSRPCPKPVKVLSSVGSPITTLFAAVPVKNFMTMPLSARSDWTDRDPFRRQGGLRLAQRAPFPGQQRVAGDGLCSIGHDYGDKSIRYGDRLHRSAPLR
jgi:hypothetical protein